MLTVMSTKEATELYIHELCKEIGFKQLMQTIQSWIILLFLKFFFILCLNGNISLQNQLSIEAILVFVSLNTGTIDNNNSMGIYLLLYHPLIKNYQGMKRIFTKFLN